MNSCMDAEARDALPELMHGRLSDLDKATLTAHVESCAECRAELEFLRQVRAAAPIAPRIDVARIVSALPAPMPAAADLVAPLPRSVGSRRPLVWRTLTAMALLVVGSLTFANARRQSAPVVTQEPAIGAVAVSAPAAAPAAAAAPGPEKAAAPRVADAVAVKTARQANTAGLSLAGVQDLSDDQLQALVDGLDKVQGLPSAEPEAVSIGVDDNEGSQ